MAIIAEHPWNGNDDLICHFSDKNMKIRQEETGLLFFVAVDKYPCRYTYTETDEPIPEPDEEEEA